VRVSLSQSAKLRAREKETRTRELICRLLNFSSLVWITWHIKARVSTGGEINIIRVFSKYCKLASLSVFTTILKDSSSYLCHEDCFVTLMRNCRTSFCCQIIHGHAYGKSFNTQMWRILGATVRSVVAHLNSWNCFCIFRKLKL